MDSPDAPSGRTFASAILTFCIVFCSSMFFCSKAIFVKMAFRYELDPVTVIALRMGIALPFFLIGAFWESRKNPIKLRPEEWLKLAGLGFLGWYLSSLFNFMGLQHISVGLERIILYTYPSLILLVTTLWFKRPLRLKILVGLVIAYSGIVISYYAEATHSESKHLALGVGLVFVSALTYGLFVIFSEGMIRKIGAIRFTSIAVAFSCLFGILHFGVTHSFSALTSLPQAAYGLGGMLAVVGTVLPAYLFGMGLKRTDPQSFAIIGMAGPLATVFLSSYLLQESLDGAKTLGLMLALVGGLYVTLNKSKTSPS